MAKNKSTYGTISKWFKWSSVIILLVPIVYLILFAIAFAKNEIGASWFGMGNLSLGIINLVSAVIWLVLNIIMFCAAGTVRKDGPSPLKIRIGLLIAMVLVLAPVIIIILAACEIDMGGEWVYWVGTLVPIAGYVIGAIMGSKLQHNLN